LRTSAERIEMNETFQNEDVIIYTPHQILFRTIEIKEHEMRGTCSMSWEKEMVIKYWVNNLYRLRGPGPISFTAFMKVCH
jgi:hypothetical protein